MRARQALGQSAAFLCNRTPKLPKFIPVEIFQLMPAYARWMEVFMTRSCIRGNILSLVVRRTTTRLRRNARLQLGVCLPIYEVKEQGWQTSDEGCAVMSFGIHDARIFADVPRYPPMYTTY